MGPQKRVLWSAFTHSVYAVGEAILGGVAWALQDWRWILRAFYGPAVLSIAVLWWVQTPSHQVPRRTPTETLRT